MGAPPGYNIFLVYSILIVIFIYFILLYLIPSPASTFSPFRLQLSSFRLFIIGRDFSSPPLGLSECLSLPFPESSPPNLFHTVYFSRF